MKSRAMARRSRAVSIVHTFLFWPFCQESRREKAMEKGTTKDVGQVRQTPGESPATTETRQDRCDV
jgi:hypothetical protein